MKSLHLAVIAVVACAAGNARTTTSKASELCDILPAPTCKDALPPLRPWDGKPLPPPQTDHGTVLIHPDPEKPGSVIAVSVDDGTVTARVSLSEPEQTKLIALVLTDEPQKTDAGVHLRTAVKVGPMGGPRKPSAEYYRQLAGVEQAAEGVASERSAQCGGQ